MIGALEWGLDADDLPEQYRADWCVITELYRQLDERCTAFYAGLPRDDIE